MFLFIIPSYFFIYNHYLSFVDNSHPQFLLSACQSITSSSFKCLLLSFFGIIKFPLSCPFQARLKVLYETLYRLSVISTWKLPLPLDSNTQFIPYSAI